MMRKMTYNDTFLPLSDANLKEIRLMVNASSQPVLELLQRFYTHTWAYEDDGRTKALLGCDGDGTVFLFFGVIDSLPLSFYREVRQLVRQCVKQYKMLTSTIMTANTFAMKLADFLGANFSDSYQKYGEEWIDFEIKG